MSQKILIVSQWSQIRKQSSHSLKSIPSNPLQKEKKQKTKEKKKKEKRNPTNQKNMITNQKNFWMLRKGG